MTNFVLDVSLELFLINLFIDTQRHLRGARACIGAGPPSEETDDVFLLVCQSALSNTPLSEPAPVLRLTVAYKSC